MKFAPMNYSKMIKPSLKANKRNLKAVYEKVVAENNSFTFFSFSSLPFS
jgi:hypothetical protein